MKQNLFNEENLFRLTRVNQAVRRAHAKTSSARGNMIATRNLIRNTRTLPLGYPACKVMSSRGN